MTAAVLLESLRARDINLLTDGQRIGVRPAGALTPDEREALRRDKAEVLRLLTAEPSKPVSLELQTVREVLGPAAADPHAVARLRFDVLAAVRKLQAGIRAGQLPPRRLVHGRPLADWLPLDTVATLLRDLGRTTGEGRHD